jgi:beta-phosphoglucomutase
MKWTDNFQLFLFDFDGLLVDTEPVHFIAFKEMLRRNGCRSDLSYVRYLQLAHANSTDLRDHTYASFVDLYRQKPDWEMLRREKNKIYLELLQHESLELLPGVENLLSYLKEKGAKRAVVTNSPEAQIALVKQQLPILDTIPLWVCRERYRAPKPDPEGYLMAIAMLKEPGDNMIGFEDSLKGLQALQKTPAKAVLISSRTDIPAGITHFSSFQSINFDKS